MPGTDPDATGLLLRRLTSFGPLLPDEASAVRALPIQRRQHPARSELYREGASCPARFIVSGWGCRQRILSDGRRQIINLLLPGDLIGPTLRPRLKSLCVGMALTAVDTIDVTPLIQASAASGSPQSGLARAIHLLDRQDEYLLRNQIVRLGQQSAYERTLHLLLELRDRLLAIGRGEATRFPMPLTQETLADVLGMTVVHVNRTLQQARREGVIELKGGIVTLLQTGQAEALTDWQPIPGPAD